MHITVHKLAIHLLEICVAKKLRAVQWSCVDVAKKVEGRRLQGRKVM